MKEIFGSELKHFFIPSKPKFIENYRSIDENL
jgi:hypothetical protein